MECDLKTLMLVLMAEAMKRGTVVGRMAKKLYGTASSPLEGVVG